ncbi:SDR family NAD(P)-dependent oxidoreductase [Streptomyces lavendofoliae]|uniref:SDR family NAD(P)-dependent oxidoreductase n=1 Tax=Streptomyces lavendofoliae TaxID=67314 RepID=UPI003D90255B
MTPSAHRKRPPRPLAGRVCLITGGAAGIGLAVTRALSAAGAYVHVCDKSQANIDHAAAELEERPPGAAPVVFTHADVCDRAAVEEWIADVHRARGRIDVFFHNAAYVHWADVEEMGVEQALLAMRTGYDALVYGVKAVLPLMRAEGGGHIIAMGSAAGRVFVKGPAASYAATKAAIEAYTEMLRVELTGSDIAVTLVRPATVAGTDFWKVHVPSARMPRIADFLPPTSPERVADAVVEAITHRRPAVDVPGYLPPFYRAYAMLPELTRKAAAMGGNGRRDYAIPLPPPRTAYSHVDQPVGEGLVLRALKKAGANETFVRAMATVAPSIDRATHRLTGGRTLLMPGPLPSLMLTTTGRRSGRPHHVPLLCHRDPDGSYLIVDSNFGRPQRPAWSHNLLATPHAAVTHNGRTANITATLLDGPHRDLAWKQLVDIWPPYESYALRAGRQLRIFRLSPP